MSSRAELALLVGRQAERITAQNRRIAALESLLRRAVELGLLEPVTLGESGCETWPAKVDALARDVDAALKVKP